MEEEKWRKKEEGRRRSRERRREGRYKLETQGQNHLFSVLRIH